MSVWPESRIFLLYHAWTGCRCHRKPSSREPLRHVRAYIEQLHATIANLHMRIAELESKQAKNSTNSSLPPSSEHPHAKPIRPTAEIATPHRRPAWPRQAPTASAPHRTMPTGHPLCAADLPPLRCTPERHRSPTLTAPGLGTTRNQTQRHRIPTPSPDLSLWHRHLWRVARWCPDRPGRTTPHRFQRLADVLLPPVQAAGRPVLEYDSQSTGLSRLDGVVAETGRRGGATGL